MPRHHKKSGLDALRKLRNEPKERGAETGDVVSGVRFSTSKRHKVGLNLPRNEPKDDQPFRARAWWRELQLAAERFILGLLDNFSSELGKRHLERRA
jgi:hypothetical protein